jgi:hypothetical protein
MLSISVLTKTIKESLDLVAKEIHDRTRLEAQTKDINTDEDIDEDTGEDPDKDEEEDE